MYKASMKLQPSNKMYPSTPTVVITPSAKKAIQTRRRVTRDSYVSERTNRLSGFTRPDSAMEPDYNRAAHFLRKLVDLRNLQNDDLGSHVSFFGVEEGEGVARLPSLIGRATWVEEQKASLVL